MRLFIRLFTVVMLIILMSSNNTQAKSSKPEKRVLIGDSRFLGMSRVKKGNNDIYISKKSAGLSWFKELKSDIKSYDSKKTVFVIGFGINDLYNINYYIRYVNSLKLKGTVYFCQVNPVLEDVSEEFGYTVTNKEINEFNNILSKHVNKYKVLYTNKYLHKVGYGAGDGIHYDSDTYKKLYSYIKNHALL